MEWENEILYGDNNEIQVQIIGGYQQGEGY